MMASIPVGPARNMDLSEILLMNPQWHRSLVAFACVSIVAPLLSPASPLRAAEVQYPVYVAVAPDGSAIIVDLNLPGLWRVPAGGGAPELVYQGPKRFGEPLNRPRCALVLQDGSILVGDTASRDVYRLAPEGAGEPEPLTGGAIGIPNSLAVDDQDRLYIADLETRLVYSTAVTGGAPEIFANTSARGLFFLPASEGRSLPGLWAVTPDQQPLVRLDAEGKPSVVVAEPVFQYPHNVVVLDGGTAFVTDGYARAIWKIPPGGAPEKFVEGDPFRNPVGLALGEGVLLVADPHARQVFSVNLESKEITPWIR